MAAIFRQEFYYFLKEGTENWEKGDSKMLKMAREVYWDFSTFRVFDFDKGEKRRKNQEPIYYTIQIFINIYIYRGSKILKKTEN